MNHDTRQSRDREDPGNPYTPHSDDDVREMLAIVGVDDVEELFDIPDACRYDGDYGIPGRSEQAVKRDCRATLSQNDDLTEFLGRGTYEHYVPSVIDDLASRSEFLTSYTQYQPEIAQGFLQALFEYQSMLVELTGLEIANCSMYDAATALGEAATLADRVRSTSGDRVLVPDLLREERRAVLENYAPAGELTVETYPTADGTADVDALDATIDDSVVMVYAETPSVRGTIEPNLDAIGDLASDQEALFCLGSDPVALSLLEVPAAVGADVVVGDASVLGTPNGYGTGLGLFATRQEFLRQVPGRLVGASTDTAGKRAFTLTLQTREQHIRKERATSNICTNQAWLAIRTAMHVAHLGPDGLVDLASDCVRLARDLAARLDAIEGVTAPVHDRHHFREFVARTERSARSLASDLQEAGFAVHVLDDEHVQVSVTETTAHEIDDFVAAFGEVAR